MRAVPNKAKRDRPRSVWGVWLLILLLAGFALIASLPDALSSVRVAGLSVLWWYGGVIAPILGCLVTAMVASPSTRSGGMSAGEEGRSALRGER